MTALLVLLFAVASVVGGSDLVSGGLSRRSAGVRLLVGMSAVVALGVLVGWPVFHLGAGGVVVSILVVTAWLCCGQVSQARWEKLLRIRQWVRAGRGASENGTDRLEPLIRLCPRESVAPRCGALRRRVPAAWVSSCQDGCRRRSFRPSDCSRQSSRRQHSCCCAPLHAGKWESCCCWL